MFTVPLCAWIACKLSCFLCKKNTYNKPPINEHNIIIIHQIDFRTTKAIVCFTNQLYRVCGVHSKYENSEGYSLSLFLNYLFIIYTLFTISKFDLTTEI